MFSRECAIHDNVGTAVVEMKHSETKIFSKNKTRKKSARRGWVCCLLKTRVRLLWVKHTIKEEGRQTEIIELQLQTALIFPRGSVAIRDTLLTCRWSWLITAAMWDKHNYTRASNGVPFSLQLFPLCARLLAPVTFNNNRTISVFRLRVGNGSWYFVFSRLPLAEGAVLWW